MDNLQIYVLLLVAVVAGWLMGKLGARLKSKPQENKPDMFHDYFVGLNYLLNDEPDEAIDTFIKALEINSDTIETHLALGALLRRRGKVDKAIKVHQVLLARQGLEESFFDETRLQLALDYIAAGLLDRAERLLKEIEEEGRESRWAALEQLTTIYQTEKEWDQAISSVQQLLKNPQRKKDQGLRSRGSHYCCELAEELLRQKQFNRAREQIKRAFTLDRKHVRASLLLAELEHATGNTRAAVKEILRLRNNHPEFSSHILELLSSWHTNSAAQKELEQILQAQLANGPDAYLVLQLAKLMEASQGGTAAIKFLNANLEQHTSLDSLVELLRLHLGADAAAENTDLAMLQSTLQDALQKRFNYRCNHCGYESQNLYWLCPSCQNWDKTAPINHELS